MASELNAETRTTRDILITAARALGRVDRDGVRGLTSLSVNDIETMALALVILGLTSISPDQGEPPETLTFPQLTGAINEQSQV